jgi:anti-sigma factor RsiW
VTCRQLDEFLHDYVEGDLPGETARAFEHHLSICPACVDYLRTYRETIRAGKAAFAAVPDDARSVVPEELVRAILNARQSVQPE